MPQNTRGNFSSEYVISEEMFRALLAFQWDEPEMTVTE